MRAFKHLSEGSLSQTSSNTFLDISLVITRNNWCMYDILAYRNLKIFSRVDPNQTTKLEWSKAKTYFNNYAPALPKPVCHLPHILITKSNCFSRLSSLVMDTEWMKPMTQFGGTFTFQSSSRNLFVPWQRKSTKQFSGSQTLQVQQTIGQW